MMAKERKIRVSEIFYSIQGEGSTTGKPSVFVRLTGCNLMCGGRGTEKDGELHNGATWRCDTIEVWLKGNEYKVSKLASKLVDEFGDEFRNGTQLIITGGEPLVQQKAVMDLLQIFRARFTDRVRVEIETNGTIKPDNDLIYLVDQFNVSPKLSNSGMDLKYRIKDDAFITFVGLAYIGRAIFKFVITSKKDVTELFEDYMVPFEVKMSTTWLMPGCSNREQYEETAPLVAEICKKHGFQFSGRLQVNIWNEVTGV